MSEQKDAKFGLEALSVLVGLVVIPAAFGTGFTQFEFIKEALLGALGGVALLWWGVGVLRGQLIEMTAGRIAALIASFAVFALFAVLWAPTWQLGTVGVMNFIAATAIFVVITAPVGKALDFKTVSAAVAGGLVLTAGIGLLDLAGVGLSTAVWDPPGAAGSFDAREFAVAYYAAALPVAVGGVFRSEGLLRIVAGAGALLGAVHFGLVAGTTFIGVYAGVAVAAIVLLGIFQGFNRISLAFGALGGIGLTAAVAFGLALGGPSPGGATDATELPWVQQKTKPKVAERAEIRDTQFSIPRIEEAPNWEARSYAVGIAFDLFREEPIVGHGPGGWWNKQTKYPRADEPFVQSMLSRYPAFRSPHNGFALVMVEYGGIGLLLFVLWLSALLGITVTALAYKEEQENWLIEHYSLVTSLLASLALCIFTPCLQLASSVIVIFAVAGLLARKSAALNDYRGMSQMWSINREGRRWDTTLFCGVVPVVIGGGLLVFAGLWGATSYQRSWGDLAMLRTQHEMAVEKYENAEAMLGGDGEMLLNLALAKKRLGMVEDAVDDVNRAAELRKYDVRILILLSELHLSNQKYADAARMARRAVDFFPNYIAGRRALAAALDLQGRMSDAANVLVRVLELDPPDHVRGKVHYDLGRYYADHLANPAKAVEHFEKAMPLIDSTFNQEDIQNRIGVLKRKMERERLMREGKPIPKELLPENDMPDPHEGHAH